MTYHITKAEAERLQSDLIEISIRAAEMKARCEMLEKENEYLRGLLSARIAQDKGE